MKQTNRLRRLCVCHVGMYFNCCNLHNLYSLFFDFDSSCALLRRLPSQGKAQLHTFCHKSYFTRVSCQCLVLRLVVYMYNLSPSGLHRHLNCFLWYFCCTHVCLPCETNVNSQCNSQQINYNRQVSLLFKINVTKGG